MTISERPNEDQNHGTTNRNLFETGFKQVGVRMVLE